MEEYCFFSELGIGALERCVPLVILDLNLIIIFVVVRSWDMVQHLLTDLDIGKELLHSSWIDFIKIDDIRLFSPSLSVFDASPTADDLKIMVIEMFHTIRVVLTEIVHYIRFLRF